MMNVKKITSYLLLCLLLISSLFVTPTLAQESIVNPIENSQTSLEGINIKDIDNYPEVKKALKEKGFEHLLESGKEKEAFLNEHLNLTQVETKSLYNDLNQNRLTENLTQVETESLYSDLNQDKLNKIAQKLGLEAPEKTQAMVEEFFLVKYQDTTMAAVSNVWYLTYVADNSGFKINILNVGTDKIDSILGSVKIYKLYNSTWEYAGIKSVSKFNVGTGLVDSWLINKMNVSDYFEYNIRVTEDGQTWSYNNISTKKYNYQRYNFATGPYNQISSLGGQRHHLISSSVLGSNGFNINTAPTIRMITNDHYQTPNWGNSTKSKTFRDKEAEYLKQKKYEELILFEVNALKTIPDPDGKYASLAAKYNNYIVLCAAAYYNYFGIPL